MNELTIFITGLETFICHLMTVILFTVSRNYQKAKTDNYEVLFANAYNIILKILLRNLYSTKMLHFSEITKLAAAFTKIHL